MCAALGARANSRGSARPPGSSSSSPQALVNRHSIASRTTTRIQTLFSPGSYCRSCKIPGLTHIDLAKRLQRDVSSLARKISHQQQPAYYDQIIGEIVLVPGSNHSDGQKAVTKDVLATLQTRLQELERRLKERERKKIVAPQPTPQNKSPLVVEMRKPYLLGVGMKLVPADLANKWKISLDGALILTVNPDSLAAKIGIKEGDIIIQFDNSPVHHVRDLARAAVQMEPKRTIEIIFYRDGLRQSQSFRIQNVLTGAPSAKSLSRPTDAFVLERSGHNPATCTRRPC